MADPLPTTDPASRREQIWLYVHESVPGASVDAFLPKELYYAWADLEPKGRVARYALPVSTLKLWTRRARRSLLVARERKAGW